MANPVVAFPDKLRIFVSSSISECAAEREQAAKAIDSLNHEPFLFERAGARPYPPRELYLPKLYEAHIFVAIYKNSYGWIAPGESLSGLEDEYRHAIKRGMPCLVYVHSDDVSRESRLGALIDEIKSQSKITYSHYDETTDLYDRLRDDIEAEVSRRFVRAEQLESVVRGDPATEIAGILRGQTLVPRHSTIHQVLDAVRTSRVVQLYGQPGSGKTTLLASLARDHNLVFVSAAHLSPLELANAIGTKLQLRSRQDPRYHATLDAAYSAVRELWGSDDSVTLAIDGLEDVDVLQTLFPTLGLVKSPQSVVYTTRTATPMVGHKLLAIPPFSREEISDLLRRGGRHVTPEQIEQLLHISQGNPLLL